MRLVAYDHAAEFAPATYWRAPVPLNEAMSAPLAPGLLAVNVYANHGRWVIECPDCSGAQIASATDYRFMCVECANVAIEGMWRPVIWPEEYVEIDELLADRDALANQNWLPGETLDDLRAEEPPTGERPTPEPTPTRRVR